MNKDIVLEKLLCAFPEGFLNKNGDFIAHRSGEYFILENCKTELEVKCKVLEWLSRAAYKSELYYSEFKNAEFHEYMLNGINTFLGTAFSQDDIEIIYTYLGNAIKHEKTVEFIIKENYDMNFFRQFEKK